MESRALYSLEFSKVLAYLAGFAVSEAGRRACLSLRPLPDLAGVRLAVAEYEQGRLWTQRAEYVPEPFPPLDGVLAFVQSPAEVLDLDALWALRRTLEQTRILTADLARDPGPSLWPLWYERAVNTVLPAKTMSALQRCLADNGSLRDEASPELALVRGELRALHRQCSKKVKEFAAEYNILHYLQDEFMTLSSDRYVLPLKTNFKGRLQGVIHDYSQTGETCYFEPLFLVELNNRLQNLKREEREEERKILIFLTSLVRDEAGEIQTCAELSAEVDLLFAKAGLADSFDGRMVEFDEGCGVLLRKARHPLLALAASKRARAALAEYRRSLEEPSGEAPPEAFVRAQVVVPSTLELLPGQKALVISGGNAGGKTVCLKSLGLIALCGLAGIPAPVAVGSVLPFWRKIHAFIGDEQSLDDHLSTFTAQISHLSRIWDGLGPDSLIILDEFGAGTDPSQGAALAQAVLDGILEHGAFAAAATHFPALKAYAMSAPGVRAASVLFDPKTGKPLFSLVYDQVGASRALDVAREHGLPAEVLRRAEHYLLAGGEDTSALVERLNTLAVAREVEIAKLDKERAAYAEKRKKLDERFAVERDKLIAGIQERVKEVLAAWKTQRNTHKQTLRELAKVRADLAAGLDSERKEHPVLDPAGIQVGDRLRHIPWKRVGTVLEVDARKARVRLNMDGVGLWAGTADLAPADETGKAARSTGGTGGAVPAGPAIPLRLDLRGQRAEEALAAVEKFLDGTLLRGSAEVEIIHGKGTGALRREIHAFLKNFPAAASFRLADEEHGGDGVTVVELK